MTLDRRLAKIDETLSPTQLVLRWLAEAHAFGDIEPYTASLLAQDSPAPPLDRLAHEATRGARAATRGKRPELVDAAIRLAGCPIPAAHFRRPHQAPAEQAGGSAGGRRGRYPRDGGGFTMPYTTVAVTAVRTDAT
jgi:hypothetical protein